MRYLELERSKLAYQADFAVYALAVLGLTMALAIGAPEPTWPLWGMVVGGYLLWSALEYVLHRFVLHGMQPFKGMHEQHRLRPGARIGTPTVVSAPLFALLVFAPTWAWAGMWPAFALTLGLLSGYLVYASTHHACHHGQAKAAWFVQYQRWHARHHQRVTPAGCYGVSHRFWDHLLGTARAVAQKQVR